MPSTTTPTPCACCAAPLTTECRHAGDLIAPSIALLCSTRSTSSDAALCGFSEPTGASTPPKKYRTKTLSGSWSASLFHDAGCSTPMLTPSAGSLSSGSRSFNIDNNAAWPFNMVWAVVNNADGTRTVTVTSFSTGSYPQAITPRIEYPGGGGFLTVGVPANIPAPVAGNVRIGGYHQFVAWTCGSGGCPYVDYTETALGSAMAETMSFSGAINYDSSTCAVTDSGAASGSRYSSATGRPGSISGAISTAVGINNAYNPEGCNFTSGGNSTEATLTKTDSCCSFTASGGSTKYRKVTSSNLKDALTNEDTEAAALARASWGAWSTYGSCSTLPCCEVSASARGVGVFTFSATEGKVKVVAGALPAGATVGVNLDIDSRNLTTLSTAAHSVISGNITGDGSGSGEVEINMPGPVSGFAFYVVGYSLELTASPEAGEDMVACSAEGDAWAGQLSAEASLAYNFVQHRAEWPGAIPGAVRNVRFNWVRRPYGSGTWTDYGSTTVSVTGQTYPTPTYTAWVDVPNDEGFQTRLGSAQLL